MSPVVSAPPLWGVELVGSGRGRGAGAEFRELRTSAGLTAGLREGDVGPTFLPQLRTTRPCSVRQHASPSHLRVRPDGLGRRSGRGLHWAAPPTQSRVGGPCPCPLIGLSLHGSSGASRALKSAATLRRGLDCRGEDWRRKAGRGRHPWPTHLCRPCFLAPPWQRTGRQGQGLHHAPRHAVRQEVHEGVPAGTARTGRVSTRWTERGPGAQVPPPPAVHLRARTSGSMAAPGRKRSSTLNSRPPDPGRSREGAPPCPAAATDARTASAASCRSRSTESGPCPGSCSRAAGWPRQDSSPRSHATSALASASAPSRADAWPRSARSCDSSPAAWADARCASPASAARSVDRPWCAAAASASAARSRAHSDSNAAAAWRKEDRSCSSLSTERGQETRQELRHEVARNASYLHPASHPSVPCASLPPRPPPPSAALRPPRPAAPRTAG